MLAHELLEGAGLEGIIFEAVVLNLAYLHAGLRNQHSDCMSHYPLTSHTISHTISPPKTASASGTSTNQMSRFQKPRSLVAISVEPGSVLFPGSPQIVIYPSRLAVLPASL
jgi:hypothetical protein